MTTLAPQRIGSRALPSAVAWTAAVINFNGGEAAAATIASLKELGEPPDEILLVDDGSTDNSLSLVQSGHPDVRILPMPNHTGRPAAVRNEGLRKARHRYVLLCDNDVRLAPDAMAHLLATMRCQADTAICSGVVVTHEDPDVIQARAHPLHYLCWSTAPVERTLAGARARGCQPGIGCGIQLVDWEAAAAAGLFDENLAFGWMDDADLHHRLNLFGFQCLSVPEAVVVHRRERRVSRTYGQIHNRWYTLLSHYQLRTLVAIAPALVGFELLLIGQVVSSGQTRSYVGALRDVMTKLPQIREQRRRVQRNRKVADKYVLSALDLDLPRHLRNRRGLVVLLRSLSLGFRWYWSMVRLVL